MTEIKHVNLYTGEDDDEAKYYERWGLITCPIETFKEIEFTDESLDPIFRVTFDGKTVTLHLPNSSAIQRGDS